jgi:glycosyltransferase involved in cell wall biosynthesis
MKQNKFVVFSAFYNCQDYVKQHIESVYHQNYDNYIHILVDDASTDNTYKTILKNIKKNFLVYRNTENHKWIWNAKNYLKSDFAMNFTIDDNDIIVLLDGDDYFTNRNVFDILNDEYNKNDYWMSYSRMYYVSKKTTSHWIPTYSKEDIEQKRFREIIWSFTHLRTFKYFLWKHILDEDLRDKNGEYIKYCYDQAVCIPMLEMSSPDHIGFIDKVLCAYNDTNPLSVEKIKRREQEEIRDYIRSKRKYETIH